MSKRLKQRHEWIQKQTNMKHKELLFNENLPNALFYCKYVNNGSCGNGDFVITASFLPSKGNFWNESNCNRRRIKTMNYWKHFFLSAVSLKEVVPHRIRNLLDNIAYCSLFLKSVLYPDLLNPHPDPDFLLNSDTDSENKIQLYYERIFLPRPLRRIPSSMRGLPNY
jgi:hypothetical protein